MSHANKAGGKSSAMKPKGHSKGSGCPGGKCPPKNPASKGTKKLGGEYSGGSTGERC